MLFELMLLLYVLAVGFVTAGIVTSFYQLVTAKPPAFRLAGDSVAAILASGIFFPLAGPMLMFRFAYAGAEPRKLSKRTVAGLAIALVWSGSLGLFLLDGVLRLAQAIA